eukprot:TRINITY_DN71783_c0_g1_i1.p1 TRINITY_DN71783_c0_g1~~TRINITY_DN71783_c0_g1_i1.p1  ORF type:complete len:465 (-),score=119.78 TRINITY_DN71783_c0_g1_i1:299-1693(-)
MTYKTIHTNYGLTRLAEAESTGTPINIPHMAVGDGNGNQVEPSENQTELVRERYRDAVNRVYQDPADNTRFTAELVVPASEGGFTLREVGVFDDQGNLFVVGNLPDTYKPAAAEGSFADTVVRVEFLVSNADIVTLQVDPNVAVATQSWISNKITAGTLIPGGTTGQQLVKASNADGDVVWQDPDVQNITVDIIDEIQTLADGQTQVDLVSTTTYGLAVYIEGVRINRGAGTDQWDPDPTIETRLTLGKAYPAGTEIYLVQNEPSGSAPAPLERNKNFSDLQSKATARTNLDVFSKSEVRQMAPPGKYGLFFQSSAPTGWLKANGAAVSRTAYADLFAAIGTTYGSGDGFNTFNLPDMRGVFARGLDGGRGLDSGRTLGSYQADDLKSHGHTGTTTKNGSHTHPYSRSNYENDNSGPISLGADGDVETHYTSPAGLHDHDLNINNTGGPETRPKNVALLACIKY